MTNKKIYLYVPYKDKEIVKTYGAKFDVNARKWYIDSKSSHVEYLTNNYPDINPYEKVYIDVSYSEKENAREFGAKFDWDKKLWYITRGHENYLTLVNMFELHDFEA